MWVELSEFPEFRLSLLDGLLVIDSNCRRGTEDGEEGAGSKSVWSDDAGAQQRRGASLDALDGRGCKTTFEQSSVRDGILVMQGKFWTP